jgi:MFS family permease
MATEPQEIMDEAKHESTFHADSCLNSDVEGSPRSASPNAVGWGEAATKRLRRKLDRRLLPFLSLLYLLSFLDRTNIGNGKLADLEHDLGIDTQSLKFNTAVAIFFPFYVAAEIPSNLAMKRFRPSIWIPSIMVAWGICCIGMGFVQNYAGLLVARAAMGLAEGGLFPGVTYYITLWYKRKECGLRLAIFFSAATAAGAFGGLLARGIIELDGKAGLPGWSWIFVIEGIATTVVAFIAYWAMHDYPATAKFLTSEERVEVTRRLEEDRAVLADEFDLKYAKDAFKDWKIWGHMLITICQFVPLYSIATFMPSIVAELGYQDNVAQLMSSPPYLVAAVVCIVAGMLSDRQGVRGPYVIGFSLVTITGFAILIATEDAGARYLACFLVAIGMYSYVPQGIAWNGNNIGGSTKRGVGMAMQIGFGNLGGVAAGFVYQPGAYRYGHIANLASTSLSVCMCVAMHLYLKRENARRDREYKQPDQYKREELEAQRERGDDAEFFRFMI